MTIGERIVCALLSYQLGISMEHCYRRYMKGHTIDPKWEEVGMMLLTEMNEGRMPKLRMPESIQ